MAGMRRRLVATLFAVFLALPLGSCSAGRVVPRSNHYSSGVDGVRAGWPPGWHLVTQGHQSLAWSVDLVNIATFNPRAANSKCAPFGFNPVGGAGQGDALFQLRTVWHLYPERPAGPRPKSFLAAAQPAERRRGCGDDGVDVRVVAFKQHGRFYEAFVWADAPLTERRRDDIETIWANLDVGPIATGEDEARAGRGYWHELSTHCGIVWTEFDGREWVTDPPLMGDGNLGPPPGWDNPMEYGTIRLESEDSAVFTSRDGDRWASFRPRVESDPPLRGCE